MSQRDTLLGAATILLVGLTLALGVHAVSPHPLPLWYPYLPEPPQGTSVLDVAQARELMDDGGILFVDAREWERYESGHIPGAIHLTPEDAERLDDRSLLSLVLARQVVVYCDGPQCGASRKLASRLLQARIPKVTVMPQGWPAWEQAGYPVVLSEESS